MKPAAAGLALLVLMLLGVPGTPARAPVSGDILSETQYGRRTLDDRVASNRSAFGRTSPKIDLDGNLLAPADAPVYRQVDIVAPSEVEIGPDSPWLSWYHVLAVDRNSLLLGRALSEPRALFRITPGVGRAVRIATFPTAIRAVWPASFSDDVYFVATAAVSTTIGALYRTSNDFADAGPNSSPPLVLTPEPEFGETNIYFATYSYADAPDGHVYVAETGSTTYESAVDDNARRIYASSDGGLTFRKIVLSPDEMPSGTRLLKVVTDPNDSTTFYVARGQANSAIWKFTKGGAARTQVSTVARRQPTWAFIYQGKIFWLPSGDRPFPALVTEQDPQNDSFLDYPLRLEENRYYSPNAGNFVDGLTLNGVYYFPGSGAAGYAGQQFVFATRDFRSFYVVYESDAGMKQIAGPDREGWVYLTAEDSMNRIRIRPPAITATLGLTVDPAVTNLVSDPAFQSDEAWGGGGRLSPSPAPYYGERVGTFSARGATLDTSSPAGSITGGAPYRLVTALRKGKIADATSASAQVWWYEDQKFVTSTIFLPGDVLYDSPGGQWVVSSQVLTATAGANRFMIRLTTNGTADLDGNYMEAGFVGLYPAQAYNRVPWPNNATPQAPDVKYTTLAQPLPPAVTVVGAARIDSALDADGKRTLLEISEDSDSPRYWYKLCLHEGQLELDSSYLAGANLAHTETGLPPQFDYERDTLYYGLVWTAAGRLSLYFATQRSETETVLDVRDAMKTDMLRVWDGSSHTAGEELGGVVVWRGIIAGSFTAYQVQESWRELRLAPLAPQPPVDTGSLKPLLPLLFALAGAMAAYLLVVAGAVRLRDRGLRLFQWGGK